MSSLLHARDSMLTCVSELSVEYQLLLFAIPGPGHVLLRSVALVSGMGLDSVKWGQL